MPTGLVALWGLWVFRATGLVLTVPFFGGIGVPPRMKAGIVVVLSTVLFLAKPDGPDASVLPRVDWFLLVLGTRELLVGMMIGLMVRAMFVPFLLAGELIGHEMAFNMAQVVAPESGAGGTILAVLFEMFAMALFLAFDFHHDVLEMLALSYSMDLPGSGAALPNWIGWFVGYFLGILEAAVVLVAPVFFLLITLTVAVGILAKTVPQMNVLDLSFPMRILGALLAITVFLPEMAYEIHRILTHNTDLAFQFLKQW